MAISMRLGKYHGKSENKQGNFINIFGCQTFLRQAHDTKHPKLAHVSCIYLTLLGTFDISKNQTGAVQSWRDSERQTDLT